MTGCKYTDYKVGSVRLRDEPKKTWTEVLEKDCCVWQVNKEYAIDHSKWIKLIKDIIWYPQTGNEWVDAFFLVVSHPRCPGYRGVKRLTVVVVPKLSREVQSLCSNSKCTSTHFLENNVNVARDKLRNLFAFQRLYRVVCVRIVSEIL